MKNLSKIRLKVLSPFVKEWKGQYPKEYQDLPFRYEFDDHRVLLKIGQHYIGFMVSPYHLHKDRYKALQLKGHTVMELKQYYHLDAQTIAVIKDEFVDKVIMWKEYEITPC